MPPFARDISPCMPVEEQPVIGLIGMGEMGTMYARRLAEAGWKRCAARPRGRGRTLSGSRINVCDLPENCEALRAQMQGEAPRRLPRAC